MSRRFGASVAFALGACAPAAAPPAPPPPLALPRETEPAPSAERAPGGRAAAPQLGLALGANSACVQARGALYCWKREQPPKLPITKHLAPMPGLTAVSDVGMGYAHGCALAAGGRVFCWGKNDRGQLGAGLPDTERAEPVRVPGIEGARALAVGHWHSCALLSDGSVSCWGWNVHGQTGSDVYYAPEARELVRPEPVAGLSRVSGLEAGRDQTCALVGAAVSCFGTSYLSSQKRARGWHHNEPWPVPELSDLISLSLHDETACGVFAGGGVGCWGSGAFSLLPSRPLGTDRVMSIEVAGATRVVTGAHHACAITERGRVSCWGIDGGGRLGRGRVIEGWDASGPEEIPGLSGVTDLALDALSTCAVTSRQELWCWGHVPHLLYDAQKPAASPLRVPVD